MGNDDNISAQKKTTSRNATDDTENTRIYLTIKRVWHFPKRWQKYGHVFPIQGRTVDAWKLRTVAARHEFNKHVISVDCPYVIVS